MQSSNFDFYDSTSIKIYNLDENMKYQITMLDVLDPITKRHCMNVGNLTGRICQYLNLNNEFTVYAIVSGYLHDIGKSRVPYEILSKPTKLTDEEFEIIKKHTTYGYEICMKDVNLRPYAEGALYHHEALNGKGYPNGLSEKDIPIVARIIRVADEYDALTTKRHYTTHVNISKTLQDMIYDTKEKRNEAIADLKKAYSLNKDFTICNYLIATDYDALGKYKDAYTYYTTYANSNVQDDEYKQYAKARAEELKQYATNTTATKK